jgi:hypothetical protein
LNFEFLVELKIRRSRVFRYVAEPVLQHKKSFLSEISLPEAPARLSLPKKEATGKTELACGYLSCRRPLMSAVSKSGLTHRSIQSV